VNKFPAASDLVTAEAIRILKSNLSASRHLSPHVAGSYGPEPTRTVQPGDGIVPFDENGILEPDDDDEDEDW
jgi:hypothetical protein